MNFSFGSNTPKTTTGIAVGNPTNPATTAATGFSLGTSSPFNLGTGGLLFGSSPALGGAGDSSKPATTPVQTAAVKPLAATATVTPSFAPAATTAAFTGFGLAPSTATVTPSATTTSTPAPSFSFGAATPAITAVTKATTAVTTTTPAPTIAPTTPAINFAQLEETIKKWKSELEEQEKLFMSQAAQIHSWDCLLNSNSDKIVALDKEVGAMKVQQQQLDHELEFIVAQQKELEEVLAPLEKQTADVPTNTDPEREHTYHMAESLDTQLKQMSEDLKEIIEHLNESSRTQDSSDPIVQIGRILNAHMNSLHWIDQNTLNIQNQLENVSKLHDIHRRENERSFRISYE